MNKNTSNSSKGCVYVYVQKDNVYPLPPDKIEIKEKMLSKYQIFIANFHSIPIRNVKKLVSNCFDEKNYVLHYENLQFYLRLGLKLTKIHCALEIN